MGWELSRTAFTNLIEAFLFRPDVSKIHKVKHNIHNRGMKLIVFVPYVIETSIDQSKRIDSGRGFIESMPCKPVRR
jgi:hypothetical protein